MNEPSFYRVSVKAIVVDETGRFLLSREDNGKWDMLGGGLEHNEDPVDCIRRELKEESGLEVTYISPAPKYFVTGPRDGHDTFVANVIYEVKVANLEFVPSDECQELRFFNAQEASQIDTYSTVKNFIEVFDPKFHL